MHVNEDSDPSLGYIGFLEPQPFQTESLLETKNRPTVEGLLRPYPIKQDRKKVYPEDEPATASSRIQASAPLLENGKDKFANESILTKLKKFFFS